jgi:hypothetical protein
VGAAGSVKSWVRRGCWIRELQVSHRLRELGRIFRVRAAYVGNNLLGSLDILIRVPFTSRIVYIPLEGRLSPFKPRLGSASCVGWAETVESSIAPASSTSGVATRRSGRRCCSAGLLSARGGTAASLGRLAATVTCSRHACCVLCWNQATTEVCRSRQEPR